MTGHITRSETHPRRVKGEREYDIIQKRETIKNKIGKWDNETNKTSEDEGEGIIKPKKGLEVLSRWKRVGAPPTVCRGYITGMA